MGNEENSDKRRGYAGEARRAGGRAGHGAASFVGTLGLLGLLLRLRLRQLALQPAVDVVVLAATAAVLSRARARLAADASPSRPQGVSFLVAERLGLVLE